MVALQAISRDARRRRIVSSRAVEYINENWSPIYLSFSITTDIFSASRRIQARAVYSLARPQVVTTIHPKQQKWREWNCHYHEGTPSPSNHLLRNLLLLIITPWVIFLVRVALCLRRRSNPLRNNVTMTIMPFHPFQISTTKMNNSQQQQRSKKRASATNYSPTSSTAPVPKNSSPSSSSPHSS